MASLPSFWSKNLALRFRLGMGVAIVSALLWWGAGAEAYAPAVFFYQYYKPFSIDSLNPMALDSLLSKEQLALTKNCLGAYQKQNFEEGVACLQVLIRDQPLHPLLNLLLAQGYIGLKNKNLALQALHYAAQGGKQWEEVATWQQALVYLQHNQKDSTLACLSRIDGGSYGQNARSLENDLKY